MSHEIIEKTLLKMLDSFGLIYSMHRIQQVHALIISHKITWNNDIFECVVTKATNEWIVIHKVMSKNYAHMTILILIKL